MASYFLLFLPPFLAIAVLVAALKNGFHKGAFFVSAGVTMVIAMFLMDKVSLYGLLCIITIPLATIYVVICLVLSLLERRRDK